MYSGKLVAPYDAFYAGLGDQRIVTTLCPGGKERMRRLMAMLAHHRVDLTDQETFTPKPWPGVRPRLPAIEDRPQPRFATCAD